MADVLQSSERPQPPAETPKKETWRQRVAKAGGVTLRRIVQAGSLAVAINAAMHPQTDAKKINDFISHRATMEHVQDDHTLRTSAAAKAEQVITGDPPQTPPMSETVVLPDRIQQSIRDKDLHRRSVQKQRLGGKIVT